MSPSKHWNLPFSAFAAQPSFELFPNWFLGAGQSRNLSTHLRKYIWSVLRSPFEVRWLNGLFLTLYPGNEISRSIFVTGLFEPNEFHFLSNVLTTGMTFIDVGANMGLYTIFAAHRVQDAGRVVSIEPSARERAILQHNIERNRLHNVTVISEAAGSQAGTSELLVAPFSRSGHNTLGRFGYDTPLDYREEVHTVTLDGLLNSVQLERVDVIKMDIEGGELSALQGAVKMLSVYHPILLLELSDRALKHQNANSGEILGHLADAGYKTYVFDLNSGLPVALQPRSYFDSENIVACPAGMIPFDA